MGYNFNFEPNQKKRPRYSAHSRQACSGGCQGGTPRTHHSKEEAAYCDTLRLLQKSGEIASYRSQVKYDLFDKLGDACGYMLVDFEVFVRRGGKTLKEIREYKGKLFGTLMEYRTKKALFTHCYPEIPHITVYKKDIIL